VSAVAWALIPAVAAVVAVAVVLAGCWLAGRRDTGVRRVVVEQEERPPAFFDDYDLAVIGMYEEDQEPAPDAGHALDRCHCGRPAGHIDALRDASLADIAGAFDTAQFEVIS